MELIGLAFSIDSNRYVLRLESVQRITAAVKPTPLPKAPFSVLGVIDVRGCILPVFDFRRRFGLVEREIKLSDMLILARTAKRDIAVLADAVQGVVAISKKSWTDAADIVPGMDYVDGVARLDDGLVLIHDLEKFLSMDEATVLEEAMIT